MWQVSPSLWGICFRVCPVKAKKWLDIILHAIACKRLDGGGAQKMAIRLSWSTQFLFHKLGRAMIKAIFAQKTSATAQIGPRLLEALHWWCRGVGTTLVVAGHARDMQLSGASLAQILAAGEWKSRAVASYVDLEHLEHDLALEAAMHSDQDDCDWIE